MKRICFLFAALAATVCAQAQLIDETDKSQGRPPFALNETGITNLNFPPHAVAYTTADIVAITTNDRIFEFFKVNGQPLVEGEWVKAGRDEGISMENGVMIAKKHNDPSDNLYLIRDNGTVAPLPTTYRMATNFRDSVAIVRLQGRNKFELGKSVFIDINGKQLPSPPNLQAELIRDINCGLRYIAPLRDGLRAYYDATARKWGYADAHGKVAIEPAFDAARSFSEGLAAVVKDGKIFFINKQGVQANPLTWAKGSELDFGDVSDYSGGMCVVNMPAKHPDHLRTYYNAAGKELGKLRRGTQKHNGTLYYEDEDNGDGSTINNYFVFESGHIGNGIRVTEKHRTWTPRWSSYEMLPRYDEFGVGHTDNPQITVGVKRPENPSYKHAYGYLSDYSKEGYAVAYMHTDTHCYTGVVDITGNFLVIISKTEN